ncbi:MAG: cyclic nucleotide-binding domain-containing protein [Azospirillaceae bacterium]|nr:cyclic nucleotide-binding domain-containing protein [Azospirillaceae bacterium]
MSKIAIETMLTTEGFFAGLPAAQADVIADLAALHEVKAGTFLFRAGEPADRFFLVRQGRVVVELYAPGREAVAVESVGPGDILGWSWLLPPYRWRFDARVVEPSTLIGVDATTLRDRLETDPVLGYAVLRRFVPVIASRLASARERMAERLCEPH